MKIAVVTDSHYGVRNDSPVFLQYIVDFFTNQFFPYLKAHGITHVIHGGDLVDSRKKVNIRTLEALHNSFFDPIKEMGINTLAICGNHDVYYKNTNELNLVREAFHDELPEHIHFVQDIETVNFAGIDIDCYGWINQSNIDAALALMEKPKSKVAFGHFEFAGFEMSRGQIMLHGMDHKLLRKYEFVGSGHYHERSQRDNVTYFGTPYPLTWIDYGCPRGFHVFDTETLELEFVRNHKTLFYKLIYDDSEMSLDDHIERYRSTDLKDAMVKIIVHSCQRPAELDLFRKEIDSLQPMTVATIEDTKRFVLEEVEIKESESTLSVLTRYADVAEIDQKDELKAFLTEVYHEAIAESLND